MQAVLRGDDQRVGDFPRGEKRLLVGEPAETGIPRSLDDEPGARLHGIARGHPTESLVQSRGESGVKQAPAAAAQDGEGEDGHGMKTRETREEKPGDGKSKTM